LVEGTPASAASKLKQKRVKVQRQSGLGAYGFASGKLP
jgi:hypothetical protein